MKELALYIHIPFCEKKCYYCDFTSYSSELDLVNKYFDYLFKEIDLYKNKVNEYKLKTIFIGGGTPSSIDSVYIVKLMEYININFDISELKEITIESNPNSLNKEKLNNYLASGINRISIGLQSFDNSLLKKIGRIHNNYDFIKSYYLSREIGFKNINVDIMFNLPNQKLIDVENTLKEVILLNPEHISFYSLKLEEGTKLYNMYYKDQIILPDEDLEREMYHRGIEILEDNSYSQYEISNFSKKNYKCKHNLFYWKLKPYLGIGISSHSNMFKRRWGNVTTFNEYFEFLDKNEYPILEAEEIDFKTEMAEYLILGLRLNEGIEKSKFYNRFKRRINDVYNNEVNKFLENGLIIEENNRIKLTNKGRDLSNIIFMELLP